MRALRTRLALTQAELAHSLGVGRLTVVRVESGAPASVATLKRLAKLERRAESH